MYEFHRDNEGTSWRIIGLTARLCIELGLHRREAYDAMAQKSTKDQAILIFWSIYVLYRRWSFGTGMPFALQDADIDPQGSPRSLRRWHIDRGTLLDRVLSCEQSLRAREY